MFRCPKCERIYQESAQRYCWHDGTQLIQVADGEIMPNNWAAHSLKQLNGDGQFEPLKIGAPVLPRRSPPGELLVDFVPQPLNENIKTFDTGSTRSETTSETNNLKSESESPVVSFVNIPTENDGNLADYDADAKRGGFDLPFAAVCLFGTLLLLTGLGFVVNYFWREQAAAPAVIAQTQPAETPQNLVPDIAPQPAATEQIVAPPVAAPSNQIQFRNRKSDLTGKLNEKFVDFSLSYPVNGWQRKNADTSNFLDIANRVSSGVPLEQMLVSWYDSKGSFAADRAAFPVLVKKLNDRLAAEIPDFRKVSEGETKINNRDAYEFLFQGKSADKTGEPYNIFGRVIFLPTEKPEAASGLTVTLIGTSLAPALTDVKQLGATGDLAKILETLRFE